MKLCPGSAGSVLCCVVALVLAGCGGGSGGTAVGPSTAATGNTPVNVRVMDGAIRGATVCMDKNDNGVCDNGEPRGTTGDTGEAVLNVANSDLGKYPMLAVVPTTANDQDTGPVGTAYVMRAPKEAVNLVTPLTTVVKNYADALGATAQTAAIAVQQMIGASQSPLADFSAPHDAGLQALANAIVLATQKQSQLIQGAAGSTSTSGGLVTQADVDQIVEQSVAALLDALVDIAADAQVTQATNAVARVAAIKRLTDVLVSTNGIKDKASAVTAIGQFKASRLTALGTGCLPGYITNAGVCVPVTTKLPPTKLACAAGFFKVTGGGLDRGCIAAWTITQGTLTASACTAIGAKYGQTFARVFTNASGSVCVFNFL